MGKTLHVGEDELLMYIRGQLEQNRTDALNVHLRDCSGCRNKLSDNVRFVGRFRAAQAPGTYRGPEKRTERRFQTEDWGILQPIAPLSFARYSVRVIDVSKNGLGLVLPASLIPGTLVQIRIGATVILGDVRYSKPYKGQFQAGLRVQELLVLNSDV